jgi:hypothetical protein
MVIEAEPLYKKSPLYTCDPSTVSEFSAFVAVEALPL